MEQYVRTKEENEVLDYDLLDTAARENFLQDVQRIADDLEVDLISEPDASNAERVEALENAADRAVSAALYAVDEVDEDTRNWMVERIVRSLSERYSVTL